MPPAKSRMGSAGAGSAALPAQAAELAQQVGEVSPAKCTSPASTTLTAAGKGSRAGTAAEHGSLGLSMLPSLCQRHFRNDTVTIVSNELRDACSSWQC